MLGIELPAAATDGDSDFAVDADNWAAVQAFCRCATQWKYAAMGGVIGLDYSGVNTVLNLTVKRKQQAAVFADLQVMEQAALQVLNQKT